MSILLGQAVYAIIAAIKTASRLQYKFGNNRDRGLNTNVGNTWLN